MKSEEGRGNSLKWSIRKSPVGAGYINSFSETYYICMSKNCFESSKKVKVPKIIIGNKHLINPELVS